MEIEKDRTAGPRRQIPGLKLDPIRRRYADRCGIRQTGVGRRAGHTTRVIHQPPLPKEHQPDDKKVNAGGEDQNL